MKKDDLTVLRQTEVKMEERKSVFIGNIKRVADEEEASAFVAEIKGKYKDATHNVYAYITGNGIHMRYSDDGEPQGTAGAPVLEVLKREGINDVCCVVTRYFGGVLLGAGGLIRAYGGTCKLALDDAGKVTRKEGSLIEITCSYELYGKINNYIINENVVVKNQVFEENVRVTIVCLEEQRDKIVSELEDMTNARAVIEKLDKNVCCYMDEKGKIKEVE